MTSLHRLTPRHLQLLVHPYICTLSTYFSRRYDNSYSQGPFKKIHNFVHTSMNTSFRTLNTTTPQPRKKMSHELSDTSSKIHHQHSPPKGRFLFTHCIFVCVTERSTRHAWPDSASDSFSQKKIKIKIKVWGNKLRLCCTNSHHHHQTCVVFSSAVVRVLERETVEPMCCRPADRPAGSSGAPLSTADISWHSFIDPARCIQNLPRGLMVSRGPYNTGSSYQNTTFPAPRMTIFTQQ